MKKRYLLITLFIITNQSLLAAHPWPMFRHDLKNTGRSEFTGPTEPYVNWSFKASNGILSSPSIAEDGTIYVGDIENAIYAINFNGSLKWAYITASGVFSSPTISKDNVLYFTCFDGRLYAIRDNGNKGELLWTFHSGNRMYSSPAVDPDGRIYFGGLDYYIYSIDYFGNEIWREETGWCVFSSPAVSDDGTMYIGSKDEKLYAFKNDSLIWEFQAGNFYDGHLIDSSPAIGPDGTIYVGTDPYGALGKTPVPVSTVFFAVNPDGTKKWSFDMEDGAESSPAIGPDGTIYIGSYDGNLYAIRDDGDKGVLKWKYKTGGAIDASPAVDGIGRIYIGSRDSTMYAFESDGSLLWSFPAGDSIESSVSIDDKGYLYFGTFDGTLYSLGIEGPDIGVVSIDIPDILPASGTLLPMAEIGFYRNFSSSFDVTISIRHDNSQIYRDTITSDTYGDERSRALNFKPWEIEAEAGTEYTVTVQTELGEDINPINNKKVKQITISDEVFVEEDTIGEFILHPSYPNPFNSETAIRYTISDNNQALHKMRVQLSIYDIRGALILTIIDENLLPGTYTSVWNGKGEDGSHVSSGIYFYILEKGNSIASRKMLYIK